MLVLTLLSKLSLAACMPPSPAKLADLDRYATARFNVAQVQRTGAAQANDQCFWKVNYTLLPSKRPVTLFLSPDGNYATPVLFDLSVDPARERAEKQETAKRLLLGNSVPDPKTGSKPTTLVVFSDYECPFRQRLDAMMHDPTAAERLKSITVQFRNFPLSMHPWAKQAALAGACVQRQNPARLPDYESAMFAAQRTIHPESADAQIRQIAMAVPDLDQSKLTRCIDEREAASDVEADLKLGSLVGVEGTPTVFINGVKQAPFRTPEQLAEALNHTATQASN